MKIANYFCIAAGLTCMFSCSGIDSVKVENPITISSPVPAKQITKVTLDETQSGYVEAGNKMSLRFLKEMYGEENLVCSPLSLQYAIAMAANGASGETLDEIIEMLGYGEEGIDALNEYCRLLLEQLPAVDLDVTLKLTDALLVNDMYPLLPSFKKTVEENYYAAVDNMDFSDPDQVAARINEWCSRSTNGFIDKVLDPSEISPNAAAYIMNALYFKAKWARTVHGDMFKEDMTKPEDFHLENGKTVKVDMMRNTGFHQYAEMDGYKVLVLPYANAKFNMYILLPDENNIKGLIEKLQMTSWSEILGNLKQDADVHVKLPKFSIENKYDLNHALMALGIIKAFGPDAEFDRMFDSDESFWLNKVIQKSRIAVSEWGTEAGSITIVEMWGDTMNPNPKDVFFHIDHPFVFIIGEKTSGTILFEGVVMEP